MPPSTGYYWTDHLTVRQCNDPICVTAILIKSDRIVSALWDCYSMCFYPCYLVIACGRDCRRPGKQEECYGNIGLFYSDGHIRIFFINAQRRSCPPADGHSHAFLRYCRRIPAVGTGEHPCPGRSTNVKSFENNFCFIFSSFGTG